MIDKSRPASFKETSFVDTPKEEQGNIKDLIKNRVYLFNLLIFIVLWVVAGFNYYMIYFQIKYMKGDFFINTIIASGSELLSYALSAFVVEKLDIKITYVVSFLIGITGSLCYIFLGEGNEDLVPVMLLGACFGISSSLNINWNANVLLFPVIFASSTNGICNFFSRLTTILAP